MSVDHETRTASRSAQRGATPVEILIGLALSLTLLAGLAQLVVGTRQTDRVETAIQQLQENGRFALELISRELRKTGYRNDRRLSDDALFPVNSPFVATAVLAGSTTSLSMRYIGGGDTWTRSCLGTDVAAGAAVVQTLSVSDIRLLCRAQDLGTGTDQSVVMLSGVEAISLTYGVDTDGDLYADSYVVPSAATNWLQVVSVNLQVRLVSDSDGLADTPQTYIDFDRITVRTPTDRKLRRTFATVVAIRNRLP